MNPLSCVEDIFEIAEFEHYTKVKEYFLVLITEHHVGDLTQLLELVLLMHGLHVIVLRLHHRLGDGSCRVNGGSHLELVESCLKWVYC